MPFVCDGQWVDVPRSAGAFCQLYGGMGLGCLFNQIRQSHVTFYWPQEAGQMFSASIVELQLRLTLWLGVTRGMPQNQSPAQGTLSLSSYAFFNRLCYLFLLKWSQW